MPQRESTRSFGRKIYLVELLDSHKIEAPATIAEPKWLSPWAVTTRYDALDDTLDRDAAIDAAATAVAWARTVLSQASDDRD
ncbi:MAG: hypothetical protein JSS99_11005 [Actinobacteria bacterium]|nr:hypothetical protein [Actinomycetota bacterium]